MTALGGDPNGHHLGMIIGLTRIGNMAAFRFGAGSTTGVNCRPAVSPGRWAG